MPGVNTGNTWPILRGTKPQQPKSAAAKIIDNPLNELKYIGKQGLRGIKKIGGAILFGF